MSTLPCPSPAASSSNPSASPPPSPHRGLHGNRQRIRRQRNHHRRLHRHRGPLPATDEVAGDSSRREDRRRLRHLGLHLAEGKKLADGRRRSTTKDYRELLDRKDIDAVLIASPDHWHVPMTVDACDGGQGRLRREAADARPARRRSRSSRPRTSTSAIVQVGTQQRSMPHIQKAHEIAEGGRHRQGPQGPPAPGTATPTACGASKRHDRPEDGRLEAFLGTRQGAAVRRIPLPELALVLGFRRRHLHRPDGPLDRRRPLVPRPRSPDRRPSASATTFSAKGVWETPDTVQTLAALPGKDVQVYFEGTFGNARNGAMMRVHGHRSARCTSTAAVTRSSRSAASKLEAERADPRQRPAAGPTSTTSPTASCCT